MASSEPRSPTVFLSYSHDSPAHADRVLALADCLRADGIDCLLDQYEEAPPEGFPRWMDRQIRAADFVLMICTPTYYRRVMGEEEPGKGHGVAWESTLIYQYIYNEGTSNARFIPVLLEGGKEADIPLPWQGVKHYRPTTTEGYEALYRRLTGQPLTPKPALGMLRKMTPRKRSQDFVEHVPNETHQKYAISENSEPLSSMIETNISMKEIEPELSSTSEGSTNRGVVSAQDFPKNLLNQEEREQLIALLCELPNINYANVRHSLVSTLPAQFQSNIDFDMPLEDHITEIVDMVISDGHFQLSDGSYPIMVLIQNAIHSVKRSKLKDELQKLLESLKSQLGVVPQINAVPTSLDRFIQYLDNFILQMPALQYELQCIFNSFSNFDLQPDCETVSSHLTEVSAPFLGLATLLKQSTDLKIISHRIWLTNALLDFNTQAKVVENNIDRFCEIYEKVLEEDLPETEWQKIQNQLDDLMEFCRLVLETAEKLCNGLR